MKSLCMNSIGKFVSFEKKYIYSFTFQEFCKNSYTAENQDTVNAVHYLLHGYVTYDIVFNLRFSFIFMINDLILIF